MEMTTMLLYLSLLMEMTSDISDTVVQTQEKEEKDDENMTFCQKFKKGVKKCLCRFCGICLGECCC